MLLNLLVPLSNRLMGVFLILTIAVRLVLDVDAFVPPAFTAVVGFYREMEFALLLDSVLLCFFFWLANSTGLVQMERLSPSSLLPLTSGVVVVHSITAVGLYIAARVWIMSGG